MSEHSEFSRKPHDKYVITTTNLGISLATGVITGSGTSPEGEPIYCMKLAHMDAGEYAIVPQNRVFPSWEEALQKWKDLHAGGEKPAAFNPRPGLH